VDREPHAATLGVYRRLIALRRELPELSDPRLERVRVDHGDGWLSVHRGRYRVVANLTPDRLNVPLDAPPVDVPYTTEPGFVFTPAHIELPAETAAVVEVTG
jgi:maltooligosyltrehalose trehalohydrolase